MEQFKEKCGLVRVINGKEWICVRGKHDQDPKPEPKTQIGQEGVFLKDIVWEGDKHRFVRRR